jgi:methyltransferase-like protein
VLVEQYLDFFVNRTFRQSLLVHAERAPQISYQIDRTRLGGLHFAAWLPPSVEPTRMDNAIQTYGRPGADLSTPDPGLKAAVDALTARWPWTLSRPELVFAVHSRLAAAGVEAAVNQDGMIDELLEALIMRGMARYRLEPVLPEATGNQLQLEEPVRRMAEVVRANQDAFVFNRWHEEVLVPPVDRHLLPLLDGTRDRHALAEQLMVLLRKEVIEFHRDGVRLWGEVELREAALEYIDGTPPRLTQAKLA